MGLTRRELVAWALYDWANSAYVTTVIAVLFPLYFASVAAAGMPAAQASARYAAASALSLGAVALLSPFLGALADRSGRVKSLLGLFVALGVLSTALLPLVGEGDWRLGLVLFGLGNVAVSGSLVFYDALLRHIARDEELDRVSAAGYALGYLGGGLLLGVQLVWVLKPGWFGLSDTASAIRVAFGTVALWWLAFSVPLFRRVPSPPPQSGGGPSPVRATLAQLRATFRQLRGHREALKLLVAYLLYSDGIGTIIRLATLYGTEVGISRGALVGALLATQAVGIPCTVLFGKLARTVGAKRAMLLTLAVYVGVSVLGYFLRTAVHFWALALLVGTVQGGSQALSRSLFARMVPRHQSGQFFALFSIFEKVTAVAGPALFAAVATLTGSSRQAVLSLIAFFVAGAVVLTRVDVEAGRRAALEAEARAGDHRPR